MQTVVINKYHKIPFDVYIGRGSMFGNPYVMGKDGDREEVIKLYEEYFYKRIAEDEEFKRAVCQLKGKTLGCFCKPKSCHGDIIVKFLDEEKV
jgi:hypothetical protein